MIKKIGRVMMLLVLSFITTACRSSEPGVKDDDSKPNEHVDEVRTIYAKVGNRTMDILLENISSAKTFYELLGTKDVVVDMHDYGNFEKGGEIGADLPQSNQQITTEPGDVVLWQGNSITIYYDVNTWSLTRLGKIQNVSQTELKSILGLGGVRVTFSLKQNP